MNDTRAVLNDLVAARNAGSPQAVGGLLADDVSYWDCERGDLVGRETVAAALVAIAPSEFETIAAAADTAVVELQAPSYRSTEVYRLSGGVIVSIKAYFDPKARHAASR